MSATERVPIKQIVFDLDDTLFDTSHQLIPAANREACQAMVDAGLRADPDQAYEACLKRDIRLSRLSFFNDIVARFGVEYGRDPAVVSEIGSRAFYDRDVKEPITLFEGTRDLLQRLSETYQLRLVTQGHKPTQEQKIRLLDIEDFFSSVHHVNPRVGESKQTAFAAIMSESGFAPAAYLSVGNRIDTDIKPAKSLGWRAAWVRRGEYSEVLPSAPIEEPDFVLSSLEELVTKCQL